MQKKFSAVDNDKKYYKFTDHCHYTEKYRGANHDICNLQYKTPNEISVVFHKSSTCNYHFTFKQLPKSFNGKLECSGENTEKYITFSVPIKKGLDNGKALTLLLRKGVYPYEYMDNWERFDETTLSNKKGFYGELDLKDITNKDYAYAQKVFEEFKVKNLLILYG